jgi:predicted dehydrogenase
VLITQAVHLLDLLLWTIGEPRRAVALAGAAPSHRLEAEDTVSALLDYGDGRAVTLTATTAAFPGDDERLTLVGGTGTAVLTGTALSVHRQRAPEHPLVVSEEGNGRVADPSLMPPGWHQAVLDDALDSFATGREPLAGGRSALRTQRVIAAVYRSVATGEWTDVGDDALLEATP